MLFGQKLNNHRIFKRLAKALISQHVYAGWSELLLVAHTTLLEIPYHGSYEKVLIACHNKLKKKNVAVFSKKK